MTAEEQLEETEGGESKTIDSARVSYLPEMKAAYFRFVRHFADIHQDQICVAQVYLLVLFVYMFEQAQKTVVLRMFLPANQLQV